MHPCSHNNRLSDGNIDRITTEIGDNQHVNVVASQRLAQDRFADLVLVLKSTPLFDMVAQIRIGVWVAVSEENRVVVVLEFQFKRQRVVQRPIPAIALLLALNAGRS